MDDYKNIFMLDDCSKFDRPENWEEVKKEIINLLKTNNFSLSDSSWLFKRIICDLGNTPISQL